MISDGWGKLYRCRFELKTRKSGWREQVHEIWDHGNGVACLLMDQTEGTVLLVRQFRLPVLMDGREGYLVEVPAGRLEEADPDKQMRKELLEETGYRPISLRRISTVFASPGSCTEQIILYEGAYRRSQQIQGAGGGNPEEGEDIEILHIALEEALAMIGSGEIRDAKTVILLQHMALKTRFSET